MPLTKINQQIEVIATFKNKTMIPNKIKWNNSIYTIATINLIHSKFIGQTKIYFFSVSNNSAFFKLQFNTDTLIWRLLETYTD